MNNIYDDFNKATAFLVNGEACSEFSFPSPDDEDSYYTFYLGIREVDFNDASVNSGTYEDGILTVKDFNGQTRTIEPLYTKVK